MTGMTVEQRMGSKKVSLYTPSVVHICFVKFSIIIQDAARGGNWWNYEVM
jgi:hypothetical protein